ncbi:Hypothetical protein A7982_10786 [Minicystis rosea]|nr:Hypothetical protein A7982_10786 [Minicystis rosea]
MNRFILWAALPVLSALAIGCGPSVRMQTPPGFAVLEGQQEYVYRATSADGVVIAVRAEKNEPRGNLDFWAEAVDDKLRRNGYVPDGASAEVRTSTGLSGREMKYKREQGGRSYRFWSVVFVIDQRVWVVEAGGDAERFKEKAQVGIQKAIESLGVG